MFRHIYEIALAVFLAQGILIPLLLVAAGIAWFGQMARLAALEKVLGRDRDQRDRTRESLLKALPKLQPLNCAACGAAVALDPAAATCTACRAPAPLPADYAATFSVRRQLARLTGAAIRNWWIARILVSTPARLFFRLMIFAEPAIFTIVLIGAATYSDTFFDRAFEAMGEGLGFAIMLMCFGGFILWMIAFLFLASLSKELRSKLTAFPARVRAGEAGATEYATCQSCGGGVHFGARAFACLCNYCGVENYRAEHTRRERAEAEDSRLSARATLFGATEIIEGFTGTFFVVMTILSVGFGLLVLWGALSGD